MKISKMPDGRYCIDFTRDWRRFRRIIGYSKREAEAAAATLRADIARGVYGFAKPKKKVYFENMAEEYFEKYSKVNKKSWKTDRFHLDRLKEFFKGRLLTSITSEDVEDYKARRVRAVSESSVNRELACLRHLFAKAQEWGYAEKNPVRRPRMMFKEKQKERRVLTTSEIGRLVETIEKKKNGALRSFVLIGLNTAMRPSEILGLEWRDVNFAGRFISIEDSKTGRSRKVPMSDFLAGILKGMKRSGKSLFHVKSMKRGFMSCCQQAKIKGVTPYCLRHTAITRMVNELGIDIVTAGKIAGHSKAEMTLRYCHPSAFTMQSAVEKLSDIFDKSRHQPVSKPDFVEIKRPEIPLYINTLQGESVKKDN